jgi:hypothetical protein
MEVRALGVTPLLEKPVWTRVNRVLNGVRGQGVVSIHNKRDHPTVTAIFSIIVLSMLHTYWFKFTKMLLLQREKRKVPVNLSLLVGKTCLGYMCRGHVTVNAISQTLGVTYR